MCVRVDAISQGSATASDVAGVEAVAVADHASAEGNDTGSLHRLLDVVTRPYDDRPELRRYAGPAPEDFGPYRTFCGT